MSERKTGLLTRARTVRADIAYDSHVNKMTARAKATLPLVTASLFPPLVLAADTRAPRPACPFSPWGRVSAVRAGGKGYR